MNNSKKVKRIVVLAFLVALGMILNLIEIPYLFMNLDVSEVVVLVAASSFGLTGALAVALGKMAVSILFKGPVGPMAIGQITALIAAMTVAVSYYVMKEKLKKPKWLSLLVMTVSLATVMTLLNYFIVTPFYFGMSFAETRSIFDPASMNLGFVEDLLPFVSPYMAFTLVVYVPFNLLKGALISLVFYPMSNVVERVNKLIS